MNFNDLLIWIVCTSCISIMLFATRSSSRGWIAIAGFVLSVTATMLYLFPAIAGLVGGLLWTVLVLVPILGFKQINQLVAKQQFGQASKLAAILRWLHPMDGWRDQPHLLKALELGQRGEIAEAEARLNRHRAATTSTGRDAIATLYRMGARWEELLTWIQNELPPTALQREPYTVIFYLRALGETGDLNGMLQVLDHSERLLERIPDPATRNLPRLYAFAFCGQREQVARLLSGPLAPYPKTLHTFWLATVDLATGKEAVAREQLLQLSNSSDISTRNAVLRRLSEPRVDPATVLTEKSRQILHRNSAELDQEARYSGRGSYMVRANATYLLISLNLLFFALEVTSGGSENFNTLYRLGALVPGEVLAGDWWRLLTATFLHFGFLHLAMNMLGLYFLGPFVEFALGAQRYLLSYFTAGIGSMLAVTILSATGYSQAQFVVGASGCIMGMVGATAAILLRGWRKEKSRVASRRLRAILFIIVFQAIFDLTTPQISFVGHTSGLMIGFLVASVLKHPYRSQQRAIASHSS